MSKWDKEYITLCKKILSEGVEVENRTGINTIKIPGYSFEFDLREEFPALTTKQLFFRQAILEMLWIYQVQSNDVRWLQERNVKIWNKWEIDEDGIYRTYRNLKDDEEYLSHIHNDIEFIDNEIEVLDTFGNSVIDDNGNVLKTKAYGENSIIEEVEENGKKIKKGKVITSAKYFGKEWAHTIGTAYGWINKNFQNIERLIDTLRNRPTDRRMIMSLWQDDYIKTAVLPSCVWSSEWDVTDGYLNCWVHQRSCDVPLGLPFNVTQYATLVNLLAQVTNLKPGKMYWSIKDAHIYVNQVDGIKEQIKRYDELEDIESPELWINPEIREFQDFDNSSELKDIQIRRYRHHGKINFPIAQ